MSGYIYILLSIIIIIIIIYITYHKYTFKIKKLKKKLNLTNNNLKKFYCKFKEDKKNIKHDTLVINNKLQKYEVDINEKIINIEKHEIDIKKKILNIQDYDYKLHRILKKFKEYVSFIDKDIIDLVKYKNPDDMDEVMQIDGDLIVTGTVYTTWKLTDPETNQSGQYIPEQAMQVVWDTLQGMVKINK